MNKFLIFFSCLLSMVILQASPLLGDCGCGKKREIEKQLSLAISFDGGCGCSEGVCCGSGDLPADQD